MAITYSLCGGDGRGSLVATADGKLVVAFAAGEMTVDVDTRSPACRGDSGDTGWAIGWRVWIGGALKTSDSTAFVAHSAGEGLEETSESYSGTITTLQPTIEVHLQLRAWHGTEYTPAGAQLSQSDVAYAVTIDGNTESGTFSAASSTNTQGTFDDGAGYVRIVGTYDFVQQTWSIASSVVPPPP